MKIFAKRTTAAAFFSVGVMVSGAVHAGGYPVFDAVLNTNTMLNQAKNIAQLILQVQALQDQLKAMTGSRGMENLLSGQNRAYLPSNWNDAMDVVNGGNNGYTALANAAQQILQNQAVLSAADMNNLTPQLRQLLQQTRNLSASQQALGQSAYQQASQRVAQLQQLVNAIAGAPDQKAALDLQARIQAEQTMLQNDQSKLQTIAQMGQAQAAAIDQMQAELRVQSSGSGNFPALNTSVTAH